MALCLAIGLAFGARAEAQARPERLPVRDILKAQGCYANLDYRCVVDILAPLPDWYAPPGVGKRPDALTEAEVPIVLEAGRILALAHLALGARARARLAFAWMLRVDPDYELTGSEIAPASLAVFYQVRAALFGPRLAHRVAARAVANVVVGRRRRVATAVAADVRARLDAEANRPDLTVRFVPRVGAAYTFFVGDDAEAYAGAPGLDLGMDMLLGDTGWSFGFTINYALHEVLAEDLLVEDRDTLEVLHVVGRGGYAFRWGAFALQPVVGLGPTAFGTAELFQFVGLSGFAGLDGLLSLGPRVVIGAELGTRPLLVFAGGQPLVSVTWVAGANVGARF